MTKLLPKIELNPYTFRLFSFWGMVNLVSGFGMYIYYEFLTFRQFDWIDAFLLFTFSLLFLHLSYGACIALFGFFQSLKGGDPYRCRLNEDELKSISLNSAPVAVIIPVYNENPDEVFVRIAKMFNELNTFEDSKSFDFFILSDTNKTHIWIQEETKFFDLLNQTDGFGRIYYRRRKSNTNGKSGNVSDFCRRYGKNYRYMIVLDADSYMDASSMLLLAKKMEAEPTIGILQTNPIIYKIQTYFQKLFQNSQFLFSKYYLSGASYWQMNSSSFWGHNAIIRLEPFIDHCALPKLPKLGALGGKILSHDTIESALIRKAGYSVLFTLDNLGSYEEYPPTWLESLQRDQRWCQGNLQHFWFLGARELNFHSKISILLGIFSYLSSVFWLLFIGFSTLLYLDDLRFFRLAFNSKDFEIIFKEFYLEKAIQLQLLTLSLLFLPKIIALLFEIIRPSTHFKSRFETLNFFLKETIISFFMAPTSMFMNVQFVLYTLLGKKVIWKTQNRTTKKRISFVSAFQTFQLTFLSGVFVAIVLFLQELILFYWLSPIWFSWMISPLLAYFTSTPLQSISQNSDKELTSISAYPISEPVITEENALKLILTHPKFFSYHLFMVRERLMETKRTQLSLEKLCDTMLKGGPNSISRWEQNRILNNRNALLYFHSKYWRTLESEISPYFRSI